MKKLLFVYNAHAGKAGIKSKLADLIDMMVKYGYQVTCRPTQWSGDATEQVEQTGADYDLIVCSGGDGTLDEVVTGMMRIEEKKPIGYIPMGSTNDFANSLRLPKNVMKAAEISLGGHRFACDVGQFNDNNFIYVAAFGIFTEVSYQTNQELKNLLGHAAYILEGAKSLLDLTAYEMRVEYEDVILEGEFIFGMVTNSISVGGFKKIAWKNVLLDDGVFEVTLIRRPKNPLELNEIVTSLLSRVDNTELIYSFKTGEIRFDTEIEVPWTLDGEYGGSHQQAVIKNWHRAVEIMVKAGQEE